MIKVLVKEVLKMVHARESDMHLGPAEPALGWNFYLMSINKAARRLAQLPESAILDVRGDSLEHRSVNWLNRRAKTDAGDKIHFNLLSDLKSSRYGFF